jgi:hypothetical protein
MAVLRESDGQDGLASLLYIHVIYVTCDKILEKLTRLLKSIAILELRFFSLVRLFFEPNRPQMLIKDHLVYVDFYHAAVKLRQPLKIIRGTKPRPIEFIPTQETLRSVVSGSGLIAHTSYDILLSRSTMLLVGLYRLANSPFLGKDLNRTYGS